MDREIIAALCASTGLPYAAERWPAGSELEYPHLVYDHEGTVHLHAGGHAYAAADEWSVTLWSERRDGAAEQAVEDALDAAGIPPGDPSWGRDDGRGLRWTMWTFQTAR